MASLSSNGLTLLSGGTAANIITTFSSSLLCWGSEYQMTLQGTDVTYEIGSGSANITCSDPGIGGITHACGYTEHMGVNRTINIYLPDNGQYLVEERHFSAASPMATSTSLKLKPTSPIYSGGNKFSIKGTSSDRPGILIGVLAVRIA